MEKVFGDDERFKAFDDERTRARIFYDILKKFLEREKKRKKEERYACFFRQVVSDIARFCVCQNTIHSQVQEHVYEIEVKYHVP